MMAAEKGHVEVVKVLIAAGAEFQLQDGTVSRKWESCQAHICRPK